MKNACSGYYEAEQKRTGLGEVEVTRRGLLVSLGIAGLGALASKSALAQIVVNPEAREHKGDILVSVFLRGGADGLSLVVPYREDAYFRARPTLAMAAPKDATKTQAARVLDLDGSFGLNPALAAIYPLYREGQMSVVHAVGSDDRTRSHFEAMNAMERGVAQVSGAVNTGWISRHLASSPRPNASPLRAVSFSSTLPDSLRGASNALALGNLAEFRLADPQVEPMLRELYGSGKDVMTTAGRQTLDVMAKLRELELGPSGGYPENDLGQALRQVAALIRSNVGLEVACVDKGGWDTHVGQGTTAGWLPLLLRDVGDSIAAFMKDLGPDAKRVTVIVQTEFGRRLEENTGLGTDHGRASCMFLIGAGVKGGKVWADWPGLEKHQLDEVGDLRVTTDYRTVLADALKKRVVGSDPASVFPGFKSGAGEYFVAG